MSYIPYFDKQSETWRVHYDKPDGRRGTKTLAKTKAEAFRRYKLMEDLKENPKLMAVADKYINYLKDQATLGAVTTGHVQSVCICLKDYVNRKMSWKQFSVESVTRYCTSKDWAPNTIRNKMTFLRSLSIYGAKHHGLPDTLAGLKKPAKERREKFVTVEEYHAILDDIMSGRRKPARGIANLIAAMWHTGARPGELWGAKKSDLKGSQIVLQKHKRDGKVEEPRVIYLNPAARIACETSTGGGEFLFCDSRGQQWGKDAFASRIKKIVARAGLDPGIVAYSFRHAYATRALEKGVDVVHLAELMGTSVQMIMKHYGHLSKMGDTLQRVANSI